MITEDIKNLIETLPKAELHVHIEGTFEPELMFEIAARNGIPLQFESAEALKKAYQFNNLQEFLDIYYAGASVLIHEQDFYDLTMAYLLKAHSQHVVHTEMFFDPQTHTSRGIAFDTVVTGITRAMKDAKEQTGINSLLIACFLRHLDEKDGFEIFPEILSNKQFIVGVGLDSSEKGHPPVKYQNLFDRARQEGFLTVAHAGEEGPADYIWEAIHLLGVSRVDHGNKSLDDESLVSYLVENQIPLTLCPLSNQKLQVVPDLKNHPVRKMLQSGIRATINSDDPAYFGGYINENYLAVAEALELTKEEICLLAENSIRGSFLEKN
jgi:adenosine deaminase